jgi:radical SAM protein with 4Fe4S-binding SPASM domain
MTDTAPYTFQDRTRFTRLLSEKGDINALLAAELGPRFRAYREAWERASSLEVVTDYPIHIGFELNRSCNLRCPMCTWSAEGAQNLGKEGWLDFDRFARIVDDGVRRGLCSVALNWVNEPLLRPDLPRFVAYARDAGVLDIMIHTNGMLLTESMAAGLIDGGLTRLMVSLDALTQPVYDKIRVGADLEVVQRNIARFLEVRRTRGRRLPLLSVNFVRMAVNEHELEAFVEFWHDTVDFFAIQEYINPFPTREDKDALTAATLQRTLDFKCAQPYQRVAVQYDGTVAPCCTFYGAELDVGNVFQRPLAEIWRGAAMTDLRALHARGEYFTNDVCRTCAHNSIVKSVGPTPIGA